MCFTVIVSRLRAFCSVFNAFVPSLALTQRAIVAGFGRRAVRVCRLCVDSARGGNPNGVSLSSGDDAYGGVCVLA